MAPVVNCFAGAAGAEVAAAPFQIGIAMIPVVDVAAEAAIPIIGCAGGIASGYELGFNVLGL